MVDFTMKHRASMGDSWVYDGFMMDSCGLIWFNGISTGIMRY